MRPRPEPLWYPDADDPPGVAARALALALIPLGWLWCAVALARRLAWRRGWLASKGVGVPLLVVGNLTVGGTGKTPLVLWLAGFLRERAGAAPGRFGARPGIVLRGYGARGARGGRRAAPRLVPADGDARTWGDEPVLLARRSGCPVAIGRDRVAAARLLVEQCGCDCVIADDGLQHLRLRRDLEIILIDGARGLGNGRCLPAGPLREPAGRLEQADLVLVNGAPAAPWHRDGHTLTLVPGRAVNLAQPGRTLPLSGFRGKPVVAVAGIGNPDRFFMMLLRHRLGIMPLAYPDHYRYSAADVADWPAQRVLMTEKDAVKVAPFATPQHWYLPVEARPDSGFVTALGRALDALRRG